MSRPRLAVLADFPEEGWPSMDLAAEMLLHHLGTNPSAPVEAGRLCPPFRRRFSALPWLGRSRTGANADRLLNRFWDYPRHVRRRFREFDLFHLCDHSYAQLVHALPRGRVGVYCHDLDTFRCLLEPAREPRPAWFRLLARHVLEGLKKAAIVFFTTQAVRAQIEAYGLVDPAILVHAPNGVCPEFTPEPTAQDASLAKELSGRPFVLHVGSCIPRKRVDVLLDVFAGLRSRHPDLQLVQVGGAWTAEQREQIRRLGLAPALVQLQGLDRTMLASLYRRALLVLQPSEIEGFGLPVIEALACGSLVVASDIPVLREVGGEAAVYCPVAAVPAWVDTVCRLIEHPATAPERSARLAHAQCYSWSAQAQTIVSTYERLLHSP